MRQQPLLASIALSLALAVPAQSVAALNAYLKLDGIEGESTDDKHKNEIVVDSWSFGVSNRTSAGGAATSSRPCVSEISLVKLVDKASPVLFMHAVSGKHIATGIITVRKAGERPVEYLTVTLTDVLVTSVNSTSTGEGDQLAESLSLSFQTITISYTPQSSDGTPQKPVTTTSKGSC